MNQSFTRIVNFTTTSSDYELLDDTDVKDMIMDRYGIDPASADAEAMYQDLRDQNSINMKFTILDLSAGTKFSVNGSYYMPALYDVVYDSEKFVYALKSIKVQDTNITGTLMFTIL